MGKKDKDRDLLSLFGVEGLATIKTLVEESKREVERKTANEAAWDIRALLDEITARVHKKDIIGCIQCLDAIQKRVDYMQKTADDIRKHQGK